jgi:fengycin family lipopeptide synthetase D
MFKLIGLVDKERMKNTFLALIQRHETLRTSFHLQGDEPAQKVHDEAAFEIEYYDLQVAGAGDRCRWEEIPIGQINDFGDQDPKSQEPRAKSYIYSFIRPFNLSQAPLLRVGLIKLLHTPTALRGHPSQEGNRDRYLLMMDMHHIISDGISIQVLLDEFLAIYSWTELPVLNIQYKDFAAWQNHLFETGQIQVQVGYWLNRFADVKEIPVLNLPVDYPRPTVFNFKGDTYKFKLNIQVSSILLSEVVLRDDSMQTSTD